MKIENAMSVIKSGNAGSNATASTVVMEETYHLPEGRWRGKLVRVGSYQRKDSPNEEPMMRFWFRLEIPGIEGAVPMAARHFHPNIAKGSPLHTFLTDWLGDEIRVLEEAGGDLRALVGREGEVSIRHEHSGWDKPYCNIESIRPVGSAASHAEGRIHVPRFNVSTPSTVSGNANVNPAVVVPAPASSTANGFCPCCGSPRKAG
jgi:hypothetical protein